MAEKVLLPRVEEEQNLSWKASRMGQLARLFSRAGDYDRALAMIEAAEPPRIRSAALGEVASAAVAAGDLARVDDVVRRLVAIDAWTTPGAAAAVARAFRRAGYDERAAQLIGAVTERRQRALALLEAVRALPPGAESRAAAMLREALAVATEIQPHHGPHGRVEWDGRQDTLLQLVTTFVDRGEIEDAERATAALRMIPDFEAAEKGWARALVELARGRDATAAAAQDLRAARKLVDGLVNPEHAASIWLQVAGRFADLGLADESRQTLTRVGVAAARIAPDSSAEAWGRARRLAKLAEVRARWALVEYELGGHQHAVALLEGALQAAHQVVAPPPAASAEAEAIDFDLEASDRKDRVLALAWVAAGFERVQEITLAATILDEAYDNLRRIDSAEWRSHAWRSLAAAYRDMLGVERAIDVVARPPLPDLERFLAVRALAEPILGSQDPERLGALLAVLPASHDRVDLAARLATRLNEMGDRAAARHRISSALGAIARQEAGWEALLVTLAVGAPGTEQIASQYQQLLLRRLGEATLVSRFVGAFVDSRIPKTTVTALPLDGFDLNYVITVRVVTAEPGELAASTPADQLIAFAVHSPSRFFASHGLATPEGRTVPDGHHAFTLWRRTDGPFELAVMSITE